MPTLSDVDNTAPTVVKVATTRFGKDLSIARGRNGRMFEIQMSGGGVKPAELDGLFTSPTEAMGAILRYDGAKVSPEPQDAPQAGPEQPSVDFTAPSPAPDVEPDPEPEPKPAAVETAEPENPSQNKRERLTLNRKK